MLIEQLTERHSTGVIDIINYYVKNTEYTRIEKKIPYKLFDNLLASEGNVLSLVALEDEKVLGTAMFKNGGSFAFGVLMSVYVSPLHIGKGVGRALFENAKERLIALNKKAVFSKVNTTNSVSFAFHKALGFKELSTDKNVVWFKYVL